MQMDKEGAETGWEDFQSLALPLRVLSLIRRCLAWNRRIPSITSVV